MKKKKAKRIKTTKDAGGKKRIVGFIGAGNMARAMMKSFYGTWSMAATDIDREKLEEAHELYKVEKAAGIGGLVKRSDVIIIAVKPDSAAGVLNEIKPVLSGGKAVVSIVAGLTIKKIQAILGNVPVVRVMPNTPALVNEGACAYALSGDYTGCDAEAMLKKACKVAIRLDEDKLNAVTAISGSGPAYFFYLAEAMEAAGLEMGLSAENLRDLIGQTMKGAGEMVLKGGVTADILRQRVTSKGGTTEQAVKVMDDMHMKDIIKDAVRAAKRRADELGG